MSAQTCLMAAQPIARALPRRTRCFNSRSNIGCITCKIRRIKCGEEKPSCIKCTSTGRRCDWTQSTPLRALSPVLPPTTTILDTRQERRSFSFFCQYTIPQLSGLFGSEFWERLVLQATHHELSIRHAAVALGAVHELFQTRDDASELDGNEEQVQFAIRQYSKSIGYLVKSMTIGEKQAADVTLMNCVLFILFETIRGHHGAALTHLDGGIEIISELQSSSEAAKFDIASMPYAPLSVLNLVFGSLDNPALAVVQRVHRRLLRPVTDSGNHKFEISITRTFSSLDEARITLGNIRTEGLRVIQETLTGALSCVTHTEKIKISLEVACSCALIKLRQWSHALGNWKRANGNVLDERLQDALHMLEICRILTRLSSSVDQMRVVVDEMMFIDDYASQFEAIVEHSTAVIKPVTIPHAARRRMSIFCMDIGIILPLYYVAAKCRNGQIRRKALELLRADQRQEGVWNSELAALVAERLITVEEEGLRGEGLEPCHIPIWNRVAGVEVRFNKEGRSAILRYRKWNVQRSAVEAVEEWIEW